MSEQINAAVIGLGVGERHIGSYLSDSRCKLAAICDVDSEKLSTVGKKYPDASLHSNADEILENPEIDVVSIASYDNFHAEQVITALKHDKHVFVEKPLCLTRQEYEKIDQSLSEKPHLHFASNLVLRRAPQFIQLKARLDAKNLGEVYYMEADYNYGRIHKITDGWRGNIPFYSVSHGGAIHMIDIILWLTGKIVSRVVASGNDIATSSTQFKYPSMVTALLELTDGSTAKVCANFPSVCPHHHALSVFGNEGSFIHTYEGGVFYQSRNPEDSPERIHLPYERDQKGDVQKAFIAQILDGESELVSRSDVFRTMAVSLAIEESLKSGQWENIQYGKMAAI